LKSKQLIIS